jgi:hypothetical protein
MNKPHDFVGPFPGSDVKAAINLSSVEAVEQHHEELKILFMILGPDVFYVYTFDTPENYNLAVSILRNKGILLSTVRVVP